MKIIELCKDGDVEKECVCLIEVRKQAVRTAGVPSTAEICFKYPTIEPVLGWKLLAFPRQMFNILSFTLFDMSF